MCWEGTHRDKETKTLSRGLNISKQTLEGILKHSGILRKDNKKPYQYQEIINRDDIFHLDREYAVWSVEGQIVALADEIAQVCHDLDDAISTGYSIKHILYNKLEEFFNNPDHKEYYEVLKNQPFIHHKNRYANEQEGRIAVDKTDFGSFVSWTIGYFRLYSQDKIREEMKEYIKTKDEQKPAFFPLDRELAGEKTTLKDNKLYLFLKELQEKYIINNVRINRENGKSDFILKSIIEAYLNNPKQLPDSILKRYSREKYISADVKRELDKLGKPEDDNYNIRYIYKKAWTLDELKTVRNDRVFLRDLIDYMASMTDQYALNEYNMLYLNNSAYNS